jgi:hypothetical protein
MSESIEEFLARGGEITSIPDGQQTFAKESDQKKFHERKRMIDAYTLHQDKKNAEV